MARNPQASPAQRAALREALVAQFAARKVSTSRFLAAQLGVTRHAVTAQVKAMLAEGLIREVCTVKKYSSVHHVYVYVPADEPGLDFRTMAVAQLLTLGVEALQAPAQAVEVGEPLVIPAVPYATTFVGGVNPWTGATMK